MMYQKQVKMRNRITLGKIEREMEKLSPDENLKLVQKLIRQIRKAEGRGVRGVRNELGWNKLYGLGKGLRRGEDAQEYVNRLRKDRI
jgi:hypothetical protein